MRARPPPWDALPNALWRPVSRIATGNASCARGSELKQALFGPMTCTERLRGEGRTTEMRAMIYGVATHKAFQALH